MRRLFLAIKLVPDKNMLRIYNRLQQSLTHDLIRWVDPLNLHLTLKFFGNISEEKILVISDTILETIEHFESFKLRMENAGVFGSRYNPRVIWFGVSANEQIKKLGIDLLDNLHDAGFLKDRQNFVPHITIGRISRITDKLLFNNEMKKYRDVFLQESCVDELILYESILSSKGPKYNVIRKFALL